MVIAAHTHAPLPFSFSYKPPSIDRFGLKEREMLVSDGNINLSSVDDDGTPSLLLSPFPFSNFANPIITPAAHFHGAEEKEEEESEKLCVGGGRKLLSMDNLP